MYILFFLSSITRSHGIEIFGDNALKNIDILKAQELLSCE